MTRYGIVVAHGNRLECLGAIEVPKRNDVFDFGPQHVLEIMAEGSR